MEEKATSEPAKPALTDKEMDDEAIYDQCVAAGRKLADGLEPKDNPSQLPTYMGNPTEVKTSYNVTEKKGQWKGAKQLRYDHESSGAHFYNSFREYDAKKGGTRGMILAEENYAKIAKIGEVARQEDQISYRNSDVLFDQYKDIHHETLPPLRRIERLGVKSGTGAAVIREVKKKFPGLTVFSYGHDAFYAFVGSENGKSAAYIINDHGLRLQIASIKKVELTNTGFIFHFSKSKTTS